MRQMIWPAVASAMLTALPVQAADTAPDTLGACLLAKTTGADRISMARWVGLAITAHPAAADIVRVTPAQLEAADRQFAGIVDRLILIDCRGEARAASAVKGGAAFEAAFRLLGEAAMREATGSAAVKQRLSAFASYVDKAQWAALSAAKP